MDTLKQDRLYELLPTVYRMRDAEQGEPLKALLQVISEQVNLLEDDIAQLYENWFIETCDDWVVPYLGDLIGYQLVHEAGEPSAIDTPQGQQRNKILIPRREVANTIRYRRRKGTLALLELLANDVTGWPARAVEYYTHLGWTQAINHLRLTRGQTTDLRNASALDLLNSPFDELAHSVDIRRINSAHTQGRYNIPSVGLFVWRLRSYSVTQAPAYCYEAQGPHCYTFSILGNDHPLYIHPETETDPHHIADEFNLPVPIRRRLFAEQKHRLYGDNKSLQIWLGTKKGKHIERSPVPPEQIIVADLSDWVYLPQKGSIAVDPVLGRIAFPSRQLPKSGVWVSYHYGFSAELGGGEYTRTTSQPAQFTLYRVGENETFETINSALQSWQQDAKQHAIIEITDSGVYVEPINIEFKNAQKSLQLRAANHKRPVIRLLDWQTDRPDSMTITGDAGSRFILDGILVTGRGMHVTGDMAELTIRHSTLVPGWTLGGDCEPHRSTEPSLEVFAAHVCVKIEHSILGAIQVDPAIIIPEDEDSTQTNDLNETDSHYARENYAENEADNSKNNDVIPPHCQSLGSEVRLDPVRICISDSILDATDSKLEVLGMPGCPVAHVVLNILRSTVFGHIQVHAIELGENCIFDGRITVARRQLGCLRFCYITPGSRTPRRYHCQTDLVEKNIENMLREKARHESLPQPSETKLAAAKQTERLRVHPQFNSTRYGTPAYCQLADCCAEEIKQGADDESEMGVFHDLYQPQKTTNLRTRIDEYLPAGMDSGIIISN